MFDTVNFYINSANYNEEGIIERLYLNAVRIKVIRCEDTDKNNYSGYLKNYRVNINGFGVFLEGSIAKYVFGADTIKFANRRYYKKGIEEIFALLNLDLNKATITRVDIGQNLKLDNSVSEYYSMLFAAPYLRRQIVGTSLYFTNRSKELIFYDKGIERSAKEFSKSPDNLLRYELKLKKKPSRFFSEKIYAKDLYKKAICKKIIDKWYQEYTRIRKTSIIEPVLNFHGPTELKSKLAIIGLRNTELDMIQQIKINSKKGLLTSTNASRCKDLIIDLQSGKGMTLERNDLLKELDSKMEITYKNLIKSS